MIRSMTGYGRATETLEGREITAEIRSVNNRYLDCTVKLPRVYAFAEEAVRRRVKEKVARGKVDVLFSVVSVGAGAVDVSLNRPLLESYLTALRSIPADYGVNDDISVSTLARFQDIFTVKQSGEDEARITGSFLAVLDKALAAYDAMRETEGGTMALDIAGRAETISALVGEIEKRAPEILTGYRARLTAKMEEVLEKQGIDESRILTEAAIFADRIAVDEETVRLRSHLAQLRDMLAAGSPIGRKLDFLLQEMNREANTIGSKSSDLLQTRTVVEIKAELEKIREQIQNIE